RCPRPRARVDLYLASGVSFRTPPVTAAIDELALGLLEEPAAQSRIVLVLELIDVLEDFAEHRVDDVGARLLRADERAHAQPHERAQAVDVAFEERAFRSGVE